MATNKIFFLDFGQSKGFIETFGAKHLHSQPHNILQATKETIHLMILR